MVEIKSCDLRWDGVRGGMNPASVTGKATHLMLCFSEGGNLIHGVHKWDETNCLERPHPAWYWDQREISPIRFSRKDAVQCQEQHSRHKCSDGLPLLPPSHPSVRTRAPSQTKLTENQFCEKRECFHQLRPEVVQICHFAVLCFNSGIKPGGFFLVLFLWVGIHTFLVCFRFQKKKDQLAWEMSIALGLLHRCAPLRQVFERFLWIREELEVFYLEACCSVWSGRSKPFWPSRSGAKLVSWKL